MANMRAFKTQLREKIDNGTVTIEDLQTLAASSKRTGTIADRVLYTQASQSYKKAQENLEQSEE